MDKDPMAKELMDKEPMDKDPMAKEPMDKEPMDKDPMAKEPMDIESVAKEPVDKDPMEYAFPDPGQMERLIDHFPLTEKELRTYSALALAYIGDCVFDLLVRTAIVVKGNDKPSAYHRRAVHFVNAAAQTEMMNRMMPFLSDEEKAVFRRGRNAKGASPAKNQSLHDYRVATGFEALTGYLYLSGRKERLLDLVDICLAEEAQFLAPPMDGEEASRRRRPGRK